MKECELAIIGGGIAGISCAIYATRAGLAPVIFETKALGGQLLYVNRVDNYPGLHLNTKGTKLLEALTGAVGELEVPIIERKITRIQKGGGSITLYSDRQAHSSKSVVIATGADFKKLGIEGEERLSGRGVSWCAVCDGFFFRGKVVAVIGGGNTAVEEALYLSGICRKVYLVHRRNALRALDYLKKELFQKTNVEVLWNSAVVNIEGQERVEKIVVHNKEKNSSTNVSVDGVFVAIGIKPNTDFLMDGIDTDESGFILTNEQMQTSSDSIYACGDCRKRPLRQLITAAAEGAVAALSAYRTLRSGYISH